MNTIMTNLNNLPDFDDPWVQLVYQIICDDVMPPTLEEHWDGFVSRRIVAKLREVIEINAKFEVHCENGLVGSTAAPISRIETHDDASFTVVIDHWPG